MKMLTKCLVFSILMFLPIWSGAQISITATAGTLTGSYPTLKIAFDAINFGIHQGQISVLITDSTTETVSAVLNGSGGTASYSKVIITPTATAVITGNIAGPVIQLNGADNVTMDGRIGGVGVTRSLTVQNTSTAGGSAVQLNNGITSDTLRYLMLEAIKGTTANSTLNIGSSGSLVTLTVIDNNEILPVAGGVQSTAVSLTTSTTGLYNRIVNNLIHDFFSAGVSLAAPSSLVSGNSIYQTSTVTGTGGTQTYLAATGSFNVISKNFIGGSGPAASGAPATYSGAIFVNGITCTGGSTLPASIDSNIITNFDVNYTLGSGNFNGISLTGGRINVGVNGGNLIGSLTDTSSIRGGGVSGISILQVTSMPDVVTCQNNMIGGLTSKSSVIGINVSSVDSTTISNNIIGGTVPGSLRVHENATLLEGIRLNGAFTFSCFQNNISNLFSYSTNVNTGTLTGISCFITVQGGFGQTYFFRKIIGNQISNLHAVTPSNTNTHGVYINNTSINSGGFYVQHTIRANNVTNLSSNPLSQSSVTSGIHCESSGIFTNGSALITIDSNTINSISSFPLSASNSQSLVLQGIGVKNTGNAAIGVSSNIIYNISGKTTNLQGIAVNNTGYSQMVVQRNTIHGLANSFTGSSTVSGINTTFVRDTVQLSIMANRIYNIINDSSSTSTIAGIIATGSGNPSGLGTGTFHIVNNMITLLPSNNSVYGIWNALPATLARVYYNSVYIGGSTSGLDTSAAFSRVNFAYTTLDIRDNLFLNLRSGGANSHYSLMNGNFLPSVGWNYSNYNDIYSSNPNTAVLWGGSQMSFPSYKAASQKDSCSVSQLVDLVNTTTGDLHLLNTTNNFSLAGINIPSLGINSDIDSNIRHAIPSMGADELLLPFQGAIISASGPTTICQGQSIILISSLPTGNQWLKNGVVMPGMTNDTLVAVLPGSYSVFYAQNCVVNNSNSITVNVIAPVTGPTTPITICKGKSYFFGGQQLTTGGIYKDTVTSAAGCDSIATINLSVTPAIAGPTIPISICSGQSYSFGGQLLTTSGIYKDTLTTASGCDSISTINLAVHYVDLSVAQSQSTLTSSSPGAKQWVDCNNNYASIPGANGSSFTAWASGSYAVIIQEGSCVDTSYCFTLFPLSVHTPSGTTIQVYPNPFEESISVKGLQLKDNIMLVDMIGRVIYQAECTRETESLKTDKLAGGYYILKVTDKKGVMRVNLPVFKK
jgi:hypothetical protein